jgi:hypothetical protein
LVYGTIRIDPDPVVTIDIEDVLLGYHDVTLVGPTCSTIAT